MNDLALVPAEPVTAPTHTDATGMVPVDPAMLHELRLRAAGFVGDLVALDPRDAAFARKVDSIWTLGQDDVHRASAASNRMLERPLSTVHAADAGSRVSTSLLDLRQTVEGLDPSRCGVLTATRRRVLGLIPFGVRVRSYFARYVSAQRHLNAVVATLHRGQDELRKDNAAIEQERANLWATMLRLRQYACLAAEIDAALEQRIGEIEESDPEQARNLRHDVQFQARQRVQDLLTHLAVCVQGYLALDLVRKTNLELIKGVERATTTTVAALRTAVIVAQALTNQRLVLSQVEAISTTTGNLIESTSEMLRTQTVETYVQAAGTAVSLEKLQAAFANVYAALDAVDTYKGQALETMRQTVAVLSTEVSRAQTLLDRSPEQGGSPLELPRTVGSGDVEAHR